VSFIRVAAVKIGPQGGTRYEDLPPCSAYVGQPNQGLVELGSAVQIPGVRNESEDFRRDLVDRGKPVLQAPNLAEELESALLEIVDLKNGRRVTSQPPFAREIRSLAQPQPCRR